MNNKLADTIIIAIALAVVLCFGWNYCVKELSPYSPEPIHQQAIEETSYE